MAYIYCVRIKRSYDNIIGDTFIQFSRTERFTQEGMAGGFTVQNFFRGFFIPSSIGLNGLVIAALFNGFGNNINVRHSLLMSLAVADLATSLFGFPAELFFTTDISCLVGGYFVTTFSLVSIAHMVALSVERIISIRWPLKSQAWMSDTKVCWGFVIFCWIYGVVWGTLPWLGWGEYVIESATDHRCSLNVGTQDAVIQSYNYTLYVFCYVIPIAMTVACFVVIKREMKKMLVNSIKTSGKKSDKSRGTLRQERIFSLVVAVMVFTFMLAWTPYTVCLFLTSLGCHVNESLLEVCAFMGKSSTIYNPIIYVFLYKKFRKALMKLFPCWKNKVSMETTFAASRTSNA